MSKSIAYILVNTGSPKSYAEADVRAYLAEFLTDPRVINMPTWVRIPLFKWIVAPKRAPHSARKYEMIWEGEASPLIRRTEELASKLERESGVPVFVLMRYSEEAIAETLRELSDESVERAYVIPLFPHYAMSSYETAVAHVECWHRRCGHSFELLVARPYYDQSYYIEALAEQVLRRVKPGHHLLISYHGIPISQTKAYRGNPNKDYEYQCRETTRLLISHPKIEALRLSYEVAYQSRFGNSKWLSPTTEQRLLELPREGHKEVAVICPSFVCDCLETTWEIGIEGREIFLSAGGEELHLVPCPNDSDLMVKALMAMGEWDYSDASNWTKP